MARAYLQSVEWPKAMSPTVESSRNGMLRDEKPRRAQIRADATHFHIGESSVPLDGCTVSTPWNGAILIKTDGGDLSLRVPSWIDGSFDSETTKLLGEFCQAVAERQVERAIKIASSVRQIRKHNHIVLWCGLAAGYAIFSVVILNDWPVWVGFLPCLAIYMFGFSLNRRNKKRVLTRLKIPTAQRARWLFKLKW